MNKSNEWNSVCVSPAFVRGLFGAALLAVALTGTVTHVLAQQFSPVSFSNQANFTWVGEETDPSGLTGIYFPGGPVGPVTLGGVPFNISSNASAYQAWNGYFAAGGTANPASIKIPVGIYGVTTVYTLINTFWELPGPSSDASLIFIGSSGATYTKNLVGNSDIRGWCCGGEINNTSTINVYTESASPINGAPGYLDMQIIALPPEFATQALLAIELVDDGAPGIQRVILDGLTVQSVPFAPAFTPLASFDGANGAAPYYGFLVQGTDGNFYGTTTSGGASGFGDVFSITPEGTLTSLYSFTGGTDGFSPFAGLALGTDGNFYGTTGFGGANQTSENAAGTVFQIAPGGTLTTLYSFCARSSCTDGGLPEAGLVLGADGNFYGTTLEGGASNRGTVFKITPGGTLTTLYSFTGGTDGFSPEGGLVQAADGSFYGTTASGGLESGGGTLFKVTQGGTLTTLYKFTGGADGSSPYGTLAPGVNGNLFGTTIGGGANGNGTVFQITLAGTLTTLHSFTGGTDGGYIIAGLAQASDGNLYGMSEGGGYACPPYSGCGTIFSISPGGTLTTLYSFTGGADGEIPQGGLLQATSGTFYGTTSFGGADNVGTVFSLSVGLGPLVKTVQRAGKVGSTVIVLGTNLTGASSVTFNGTAAAFTVVSPTEITAVVPAGATLGPLAVTTPGGTLFSSLFQVEPSISSFLPASGGVGTVVTITGENLTGATRVSFGGIPATSFTVNSYTQITATVPAGAVTGAIVVTTPGGTAASTSYFRITRNATTTSLSSSLNPSTYGQSVTFSAQVSSTGATPTGTVEFANGSTPIGEATLSGGVATFTTNKLPAGADSITAVYGATASFLGSTSAPLSQSVMQAATATLPASSIDPSTLGQSVTLRAIVTSAYATPIPNGEIVTFYDGTAVIGTGTLDAAGAAFLSTSSLAVGSHSITATYVGDANYQPSTSPAFNQGVTRDVTTTTLSSNPNPSAHGQSVTFTATVSSSGPTPAGLVTFMNGSSPIGKAVLSGGVATFTTTNLPVGTDSITAVYGGSTSSQGSTSAPLEQSVT